MHSLRRSRPSPTEAETFQFVDPSPGDARSRQRWAREIAKVEKNCRNCERREKRAKEKLREMRVEMEAKIEDMGAKIEDMEVEMENMEVEMEDMKTVTRVTLDENKTLHERLTEMKSEVRRLIAKFNSRVRREPLKIETAVQRALSTVFDAQQPIYHVKTEDGTIQNWARNVILHLVCASDVPASKTWTVFSCIKDVLRLEVIGSWSDRSARRIVFEGALAAEEMIVEEFSEALGILPTCPSPFNRVNPFVSVYPQWRWSDAQGYPPHISMGSHGTPSRPQTERPLPRYYARAEPHRSYPGRGIQAENPTALRRLQCKSTWDRTPLRLSEDLAKDDRLSQ